MHYVPAVMTVALPVPDLQQLSPVAVLYSPQFTSNIETGCLQIKLELDLTDIGMRND